MVDIHALNILLWAVIFMCTAAVGSAAVAITAVWLADRRHHTQHVARGVRAAEAHLAAAARDRVTR
jgi:hypothetical protein